MVEVTEEELSDPIIDKELEKSSDTALSNLKMQD